MQRVPAIRILAVVSVRAECAGPRNSLGTYYSGEGRDSPEPCRRHLKILLVTLGTGQAPPAYVEKLEGPLLDPILLRAPALCTALGAKRGPSALSLVGQSLKTY
jgi:hypothetical protein